MTNQDNAVMRSMYLKEADSGDLIDVSQLDQLLNPLSPFIVGRRQAGEEEQEEESFQSSN